MRLHETRHIDRPRAEVFAYVADFANSAEWDPGVVSATRRGAGPVGEGAQYDLAVEFGSRAIPMTYVTTAYEPTSRVVFEGAGDSVTAVDEIRFEDRDGGTLVDYTADIELTNWMRWIMPLLRPVLRRVGERALDGMVQALQR